MSTEKKTALKTQRKCQSKNSNYESRLLILAANTGFFILFYF